MIKQIYQEWKERRKARIEECRNWMPEPYRITPEELEEINQAVKRYNQSLEYARQGGEDLAIIQLKKAVAAHPTYVKAYQLLALLYIKTEQYASARQILRKVHRLDATDEKTIRYMHELTEIRKERPMSVKQSAKNQQKTVKYQLGNESIIQPVPTGIKEKASIHTVANIAVGVLVGVAVMWFLIMPAINSSEKKALNKQTVSFSDQIAEQKSQISALKTELETYRASSEETENAQSTAASTQDSYEVVMNIAEHYKSEDMSNAAMAEELMKVNADSLGAVGRAKFDELTHDLVERTATPVNTALRDAGLTASEISKVLLVGGSTRIPAVQDKVKALTGHEPSKSLNPDECVALGASVQGGKLAGDAGAGDILLLDVTPLSLSIETMGGVATRLIERNTTIPTKKSQIFSTAADNQTAVDIHVVQGERQFAKDNKSLGQFRLDGIPPARRGVPQIEVTFDIDANGIVNVSAKDLGTGKEQHITITSGSNMSESDIDKAVKEAAEYEAQDKKRKEAIDTRNDADAMVFQTEKALEEVGDKVDANDKTAVEADLNELKDLIAKSNPEEMTESQVAEIKAAKEKLMESAQKVFAKMYEQQAQANGAAQAGPDMNAGADNSSYQSDDVVDGDYKEV